MEHQENITTSEREQPIKAEKKSFLKRRKNLLILSGVVASIGIAIGIAAIMDGWNGIKTLGNFATDQILGMQWLNTVLVLAFRGMFGAEFLETRWGGAIQFFIYDTIKLLFCSVCLFLLSLICKAISLRNAQRNCLENIRAFGQILWVLFSGR